MMTQDIFDDDDVTRLLKKTRWPEADTSLRYKIEQAVCGESSLLVTTPQGWAMIMPLGTRESLLSFAGLVLALVIGFASGLSGTSRSGVAYTQVDFYGASGASLTALYFGQEQRE